MVRVNCQNGDGGGSWVGQKWDFPVFLILGSVEGGEGCNPRVSKRCPDTLGTLLDTPKATARRAPETLKGKFIRTPRFSGTLPGHFVRSEKLQNESSPNFSNFRPEFCPEFCSELSRIFRGVFVLRFVGNGDQEKFTKNPRHFSMQNSQANTKQIFTKFFWRVGKETLRDSGPP